MTVIPVPPAAGQGSGDQSYENNQSTVIESDGTQKWYLYGELHRADGPAIAGPNGTEEWFWHGEKVSRRKHARLQKQ